MKRLGEIFCKPGLRLDGRTIQRTAVRAIIREHDRLLMIYSPVNGDYKFPGGGVNAGERLEQALAREVREECGVPRLEVLAPYGSVVEYDQPQEPEYDLFRMESYYYLCRVGEARCAICLDDYERDLAFQAVWVPLDEAIHTNRAVLGHPTRSAPRWTQRDTWVLERLKEENREQ